MYTKPFPGWQLHELPQGMKNIFFTHEEDVPTFNLNEYGFPSVCCTHFQSLDTCYGR